MNLEQEKRGQAMKTSDVAAAKKVPDFRAKAREIKLRTALASLAEGKLATAAGGLFDLYSERPLTPEGSLAGDKLVEIAEGYENGGQMRLAIELYEKLARADS